MGLQRPLQMIDEYLYTGSVGQGGSATSLSLVAVVVVYGCMDGEAVPLAYV